MVKDPIFVILGAGASHACTSQVVLEGAPQLANRPKPPLVTGLFSATRIESVLSKYPQALSASAAIRRAGSQALAIENWIREHYKDSSDPVNRAAFVSISYYLQHLL